MEYDECAASVGCASVMAPVFGLFLTLFYIAMVAILDVGQANLGSSLRVFMKAVIPWAKASEEDTTKGGHLRYSFRVLLRAAALFALITSFALFAAMVTETEGIAFVAMAFASFVAIGMLGKRGRSFTIRLPSSDREWEFYPVVSLVWHMRSAAYVTAFYLFMRFASEVDL